jgi:glutamate 5-kinase
MSFNYRRIIIKIGSNVITRADGLPDVERIAHLVNQIAEIKKQGN